MKNYTQTKTRGAKAVTYDASYMSRFDAEKLNTYCLTDWHVQLILSALTNAQWRTRWFYDSEEDYQQAQSNVMECIFSLMASCGDARVSFVNDNSIEIGCNEMATINIYECGCGCGDANNADKQSKSTADGVQLGGAAQGGTDGGYDDIRSLCSFATNIVPFMVQQVENFNDMIANGQIVDLIPAGGGVIDYVKDLIAITGTIDAALNDIEFMTRAKLIAVKHFPDPMPAITRDMLFSYARKMPLMWSGAPLQAVWLAWARFANVDAINYQMLQSSGICSEEVSSMFTAIGRQQVEPIRTGLERYVTTVASGLHFHEYAILSEEILVPGVWFTSESHDNIVGVVHNFACATASGNNFSKVRIGATQIRQANYDLSGGAETFESSITLGAYNTAIESHLQTGDVLPVDTNSFNAAMNGVVTIDAAWQSGFEQPFTPYRVIVVTLP